MLSFSAQCFIFVLVPGIELYGAKGSAPKTISQLNFETTDIIYILTRASFLFQWLNKNTFELCVTFSR